MQMSKKMNAFTIHEMLVVLIVASLVISISMLVLNLLQKQFLTIRNGYATKTEMRLFERTFANDFQLYDFSISKNTDGIVGTSELGAVYYKFDHEFVMRNQDTIFVKVQEKNYYLDNVQISLGVVDAIDLTVNQKKRFFYKPKAAAYYMEQLWLLK